MIRNNDFYAVSAYELGLQHGFYGIPGSATACPEYKIGHNIGAAMRGENT